MRISIDWFKEFVKTNDSTEDIANTLTMLGLEAENAVDIAQLEDIIDDWADLKVKSFEMISLINISAFD